MTTVILRNGVKVDDPSTVVLGFVEAWGLDEAAPAQPMSFGESDLRRANRGGARSRRPRSSKALHAKRLR